MPARASPQQLIESFTYCRKGHPKIAGHRALRIHRGACARNDVRLARLSIRAIADHRRDGFRQIEQLHNVFVRQVERPRLVAQGEEDALG